MGKHGLFPDVVIWLKRTIALIHLKSCFVAFLHVASRLLHALDLLQYNTCSFSCSFDKCSSCANITYDIADSTRPNIFPLPQPHPHLHPPEALLKTPEPPKALVHDRTIPLPQNAVLPTIAARLPTTKRSNCDVLSKRARESLELVRKKLLRGEEREVEVTAKRKYCGDNVDGLYPA